MFALQNADVAVIQLPDLEISPVEMTTHTAKFDLLLSLSENDAQLSGGLEYNTDLFAETTAESIVTHYITLLTGVVADIIAPISQIPMLSKAELKQLIIEWNQTKTFLPKLCLHQRFEEQANLRPDAIAVVYEEQRLSYRELDHRASLVANQLQKQGVGRNTLVGLCLERSTQLIVGLMGILKAGGAYLPLDPSYPEERLAMIMEDAAVAVIVTQEKWKERFPQISASMLCLDTDWDLIELNNQCTVQYDSQPDDIAYVIYTSGSTGKPKGVQITHHNVERLFDGTQGWFAFDHTDVWTLFHSYAFDFSVWEIWGALFYGGKLVIVPYIDSRSPEAFHQLLTKEKVTILNQTPSAFYQLMHVDELKPDNPLSLRTVIFGGEALDLQALRPWFERHGEEQTQLINMYGITETTVHVTYRPITLADVNAGLGSVIGEAIPDLKMYILDSYQNPVPIGVPGEMCIGGAGLAVGYLKRPELTEARFITSPFDGYERILF